METPRLYRVTFELNEAEHALLASLLVPDTLGAADAHSKAEVGRYKRLWRMFRSGKWNLAPGVPVHVAGILSRLFDPETPASME